MSSKSVSLAILLVVIKFNISFSEIIPLRWYTGSATFLGIAVKHVVTTERMLRYT